ncbi:MAG: tetratricopeptide repeat protein [Acidimicrobiia bacterium]
MSQLPSGTVTFLFTDIEGSTRLAQDLGPDYQSVIEEHHRLVREGLDAGGGTEVSTEGDSFFCVFTNTRAAVETAASLQRALASFSWSAGAEVRVRMGLHTGEGTLGGDNYIGLDVHRAARIAAAAHGGQVLVSDATRALTETKLPRGVALSDLGLHGMRDLPHPERLHQLLIDGLPNSFPAPRSVDAQPNNLPTQLTSFVGRDQELAEAADLIGGARLLTLTGVAGSGKTRLALESAARVVDRFPHGVWFVELAALTDAAFLEEEVATVLRIQQQPGRDLFETILEVLRPKAVLIVLDNCEHVLDSAAKFVGAALGYAPNLRVVATSREPLGVPGEVTLRVAPLSLPQADEVRDGAGSGLSDAVRLFADRGASADPSFRLTADNAESITHICQRLDGLPLAIELAAARLRSFSPAEIASRLDDRFGLLTGGTRTSLPRQHTLRAAVDWSYELLSDAEQKLFDRLSVFADGFTMDAVEAVCGEGAVDVVDTVIRLVDQSMVVAESRLGSGTRYRLLETLRQYGWQRLEERGEDVEIRTRHAEFFLRISDEARPHLHGRNHGDWMQRLSAEHENCRAALDWCRDTGEVEVYLRLVAGWGGFWLGFGLWAEARRRLTEALDLERGKHPELRLGAILASAQVFVAEDRDRAGALAEEALDLADRHGDAETMVSALILGGYTAKHHNDIPRAEHLLERALQLSGEEGMEHERARALVTLGNVYSRQDNEKARYYLEEGLALHRKLENLSGVAQALHYLGAGAASSGDFDDAVAWLEEGLRVDALVGGRDNSGHILMELGEVRRLQGDAAGATKLLWKGLEFLTDAGDQNCAARTRTRLGLLALSEGSFSDANDHLATSLVASARIGDGNVVAALEGFAFLAAATGDPQQAVVVFSATEGIRRQRGMTASAFDLVQRDRELDAVRQQLGKEASAMAWDRGAAMSLDDAISVVIATQGTQQEW